MRHSFLTTVFILSAAMASARPLVVGISDSCAYDQGPDVRYYMDAVERAGHIPVIIGMTLDTNRLASIVARLDTLLMTGGADVEPSRYGAVRSPRCGGTDPKRDAYEFALVAAARARHLPIAGICRGVQLLNVAFGGTLYQDLPSEFKVADGRAACSHNVGRWDHDHTNPPAHTVSFAAGSRWAQAIGTAPLAVNSHHHQAVLRLAPGFRIAAQAPDGVIEAIESDDYPVIGVQFHPESLISTDATKGFDRDRLLRTVMFLCEHAHGQP